MKVPRKLLCILSIAILCLVFLTGCESENEDTYQQGLEDGTIEGYNKALSDISEELKNTNYSECLSDYMDNYEVTEMSVVFDPDEGAITKGNWKKYNRYMQDSLSENIEYMEK